MHTTTAREAYEAVLHELKHENTTSMTPEEFNYHWPVAELQYLAFRYWAHDQHQKSIDDLRKVKIETDGVGGMPQPLVNQGPDTAGDEFFILPDDYLYLLNVGAVVRYIGEPCLTDGTLSQLTSCTYLSDDREKVVRHDYYQKPSGSYPTLYYKQRGSHITIKAGTSIAQSLTITYLKYPVKAQLDTAGNSVTNPEFDTKQVLEIAKWCTQSYLENIQSYRLQSMALLEGKTFQQYPPPNRVV